MEPSALLISGTQVRVDAKMVDHRWASTTLAFSPSISIAQLLPDADAPYQMSLRIIRESHKELPGGCADGKLGNPGRL